MRIGSNKIIILLGIVAIILAGIFCSAYFQMSNGDCPGAGHTDVWCNNVVVHGSIISNATISNLFILLISVFIFLSFLNFRKIQQNFFFLLENIRLILYNRKYFFISNPLQLAFSRGILHPKKPVTF